MSLRVYRSVRRLRRFARFGAEVAGGELPTPTDVLFLARLSGSQALMRYILPLFVAMIVADIVKMIVVDRPWESPDDKRRNQLKEIYGETEGETRWQKEFIEREIQVDLQGESA